MRCLVLVAALSLSGSLHADVFHLKTGGTIEGKVIREENGKIWVRTATSTVQLEPDEVVRIEKRKAPAEEFEDRLEKVPPGDREALLELVSWTREKGLREELREACRKVLEIDPNQEMAREELGYVVFENVWILESELEKNRKEKGLVKHLGEWMTEEERDRHLLAEARREIDDLMESVLSDNRYVQQFAVEKIMARRGPHDRSIFASYLGHGEETVRIVAASALSNLPVTATDARAAKEAKRITAKLYERLLSASSENETDFVLRALRYFYPSESFRLALETLEKERNDEKRAHALEVVYQTIRKKDVPELCRALEGGRTSRRAVAIRSLLEKIFDVDFGYDVDDWLAWWEKNSSSFTDHP